jgi:hypothetical protein
MTELQQLKQYIEQLESQLKEAMAQKEKDWDLINSILDHIYVAEKDHDVIVNAERHAKEMQEISDFYNDEKNKDAYTMSIIDLEFADVVK